MTGVRVGLVLSGLLLLLAGGLLFLTGYVLGPVRSGQAGGGERGAVASPAAWPEREATTIPFRFDVDGNLLIAPAPTPTETPSPPRTPRPTSTPLVLCPPASGGGMCWWPTPTPPPITVTPIPTCGPELPGQGCIWTRE